MSLATLLATSPLTATASLVDREMSIANDGSITQTPNVLIEGIVGGFTYITGTQKLMMGALTQSATHLFITNYQFTTIIPENGDVLYLNNEYYTILDAQNSIKGIDYCYQFYLQEIKV